MGKLVPVLLFATFLSACGPLALDKPVINDPVAFQRHVQTAETYVTFAIQIADNCVAARVPYCVSKAAEIAEAKRIALEALQQAKDEGKANPTLGQTLLRVAMNAVLLFYSFK